MIIEEKNPYKNKREIVKKIFSLLKDITLPKHYKFVDDCVQIRYKYFLLDSLVAEIILVNKNTLEVCFRFEEDLKKLRKCFEDSKTKFKLNVEELGYY